MSRTCSVPISLIALLAGLLQLCVSAAALSADGPALKLDLWNPGDEGQRLFIRGRVSSESGVPIANATLFFRQADGTGDYTEQYQGSLQTDPDGTYTFGTVMPGQYTSEKHIHVYISHTDYFDVSTEIRFKGDPNLEGASHDENAIVIEEATIKGVTVLIGEFNVVLRR